MNQREHCFTSCNFIKGEAEVKTPCCGSPAVPLAAELHSPCLHPAITSLCQQAFVLLFPHLLKKSRCHAGECWHLSLCPWAREGVHVCLVPWARQDHSCCSAWQAEGKVSGAPCCSGKPASSALPGAWPHPEDGSLLLGWGPGEGGLMCAQLRVCSNAQRSFVGIWALLGIHSKHKDQCFPYTSGS